jgi:hypothetical protein
MHERRFLMSPREGLVILLLGIGSAALLLWFAETAWGPLSGAQRDAVLIAGLGIFGAALGWEQYRKTVPLRLMLLPLGVLVAVLLGIAGMVFFGEGLSAFLPVMLPLAIGLGIGTAWWIERRAKAAGHKPDDAD